MPKRKARTATRDEIAQFGHIAAALRAFMKANGLKTMADFNEVIGRRRNDTASFKWLKGTGAPGPTLRAEITKATGISEAALLPRRPGDPVPALPSPSAVVLPHTASGAQVASKRVEVLLFSAASDGEARVRLDVTLPIAEASALFQMLLGMENLTRQRQEPQP